MISTFSKPASSKKGNMLVGPLEIVLFIGGLLAIGDGDIIRAFYGFAWLLFYPVPRIPPWHAHRRIVDLREYDTEEDSEDESEDEKGEGQGEGRGEGRGEDEADEVSAGIQGW